MEDLKNDISYVSKEAEKTVRTEIDLLKIELIENTSYYVASIFSRLLLLLLALVVVIFGLFALTFFLNQFLPETWMSASIVFGSLAIVFSLLFGFRKALLSGPIQDSVIKEITPKIFKK